MPISRERAVDLSHRILARLEKTPGVELRGPREEVRNGVLQALLGWEKENGRLSFDAAKRVAARGKRVAEGSREWDLLLAEELEKAYAALLGRGE